MYDLTQTAFLFSVYANAASSIGGSAPQLAALLDLALDRGGEWTNGKHTYAVRGLLGEIGDQLYGSDWSVAWGPAIYQPAKTRHAANAVAVLHSASLDLYVVATAGTNMDDVYDWFREDLAVGPNAMVDFPISLAKPPVGGKANSAGQQIDLGTACGIYNLLKNVEDSTGHTRSLIDFLAQLKPTSSAGGTIVFVGHSLGGALSAALPLQVLASIDNWGWTAQGGRVCAMPTAAPTPGNQAFSTAWGKALPPLPVADTAPSNQVKTLNTPVENAIDLVPHAWTNLYARTQNAADPFYFSNFTLAPPGLASLTVRLDFTLAVGMAGLAAKAQLDGDAALMAKLPNVQLLQPSFPITYWDPAQQMFGSYNLPPLPVSDLERFETVLFMVHVWQYFPFFGITTSALPYPVTSQQSRKAARNARAISAERV